MSRAPFQVLVLPFIQHDTCISYAIFHRSDMDLWQGISGGGEDTESPLQAAVREAQEEAGIPSQSKYIQLDTTASIPVSCFSGNYGWSSVLYVIPEHSFGVEIHDEQLTLSSEHIGMKWCSYESAYSLLKYDSNRTALWELNERLKRGDVGPSVF
jgi:dihydroneopterin triphosphate diphosphatase